MEGFCFGERRLISEHVEAIIHHTDVVLGAARDDIADAGFAQAVEVSENLGLDKGFKFGSDHKHRHFVSRRALCQLLKGKDNTAGNLVECKVDLFSAANGNTPTLADVVCPTGTVGFKSADRLFEVVLFKIRHKNLGLFKEGVSCGTSRSLFWLI